MLISFQKGISHPERKCLILARGFARSLNLNKLAYPGVSASHSEALSTTPYMALALFIFKMHMFSFRL